MSGLSFTLRQATATCLFVAARFSRFNCISPKCMEIVVWRAALAKICMHVYVHESKKVLLVWRIRKQSNEASKKTHSTPPYLAISTGHDIFIFQYSNTLKFEQIQCFCVMHCIAWNMVTEQFLLLDRSSKVLDLLELWYIRKLEYED